MKEIIGKAKYSKKSNFPWKLKIGNKLAQSVSINERIERCGFFSLKTNKSPGADETNFNVIEYCFGELWGPLKYLFDLSLQSGVFLDLMKISILSPV